MASRTSTALALGLGLALGLAVSLSPPADAGRNTGGTYSLPAGNPVVSGTTITSTWANSTLGDISTEMTNSLSRDGYGSMRAALKVPSGTPAAPTLTFVSDAASGLYLNASSDVRMSVASTDAQRWTSTAVTVSKALTCSVGATITNSTSNGAGLTTTGNGTGAGVVATGGATGAGGTFTGGASGGNGLTATGTTSNAGVSSTGGPTNGFGVLGSGGGTTGTGVRGIGGSSGGIGVSGLGTGAAAGGAFQGGATGPGVSAFAGTAATATARQTAALLNNGDLSFSGTVNPNSNIAFTNVVTAKNAVKAWGSITCPGTGGTTGTVNDGFNISGATVSGNTLTVTTLGTALASGAIVVATQGGVADDLILFGSVSGNTVSIRAKTVSAGNLSSYSLELSASRTINFVVLGAQ